MSDSRSPKNVSRRAVIKKIGVSALPFVLAVPSRSKAALLSEGDLRDQQIREQNFEKSIEEKLAQGVKPFTGGSTSTPGSTGGTYNTLKQKSTSTPQIYGTNNGDHREEWIFDQMDDYYKTDVW